jgi:drug/metabolite transporter (DMT)-like permease
MTQDEPRETPAPPSMPATSLPSQAPPYPAGFQRRVGKTRNPWGVWLLALVTLGIYGLYWYYKINEETRDYDQSIRVDPTLSLLALLFGGLLCSIPTIISIINTGSRIQQAQKAAGASERCSGGLGLLFAILGGFHHVYYQSQINKVWDQYGNPEPGTVL